MKRAVILAVIASLPLAASADMKSDFQRKYADLDQKIAKRDKAGSVRWVTDNTLPAFTYKTRQGNEYKRDEYVEGLRQQIDTVEKVVESTVKVLSVSVKGTVATVIVKMDSTVHVSFDGRPMKLVDTSKAKDVWIKSGATWKLKRSVQTGGETQMYPR